MKTIIPELLAPAGSMESLTAAVSMGCDAVYLGGRRFSARMNAENFTEAELEKAVDYCHLRGVRVFTTVNTLYKDKELNSVLHFAEALYTMGVDAVILQDLGLARLIKLYFPDLSIHASTQMTAHSLRDVLFLKKAGFDRVVLSRELSLAEIKEITGAKTGVETEVFIHGALCVCYSGQCLMSSLIGGRSGNRGNCAGPCRQRYALVKRGENGKEALMREGYLLSPRDLMTLDYVQALAEAGVSSFKIEGRMRSTEYVTQTVRSYRQALDCGQIGFPDSEKDKLVRIFNRGGASTAGYLRDNVGFEMMSIDTPKATGEYIGRVEAYDSQTGFCDIKLMNCPEPLIPGDGIEIWTKPPAPHCGAYINKPSAGNRAAVRLRGSISSGDKVYRTYDKALCDRLKADRRKERKLSVHAGVAAKKGVPLTLYLQRDGVKLCCRGAVVEKAATRPVPPEEILARLMKTGATAFTLSFAEFAEAGEPAGFVKTEIEEDIFIDIKELNRLRREALEQFEEKWIADFKRERPSDGLRGIAAKSDKKMAGARKISVLVRTREQYIAALERNVDRLYVEAAGQCHFSPSELSGHFAALPRIDREDPEKIIARLEQTDIKGYLARTWGQLDCLGNTKKIVAADYSLSVFNQSAQEYLLDFCRTCCLSPELNEEEAMELACDSTELILYGRLAAMVTRLCPVGNYVGKRNGNCCNEKNKQGHYFLRDETRAEFPVYRDCQSCISFILNSRPIYLAEKADELQKIAAGFVRFEFTVEDGPLTGRILDAYMNTEITF